MTIDVIELAEVNDSLMAAQFDTRRTQNFCSMTKHYILSLNPTAKHDWDRCILRDPITAKRPEIAKLIAEAIGAEPGTYLVSVNIEVKVLEQVPAPQAEQLPLSTVEERTERTHLQELVA